jgi:hypothetical protein
MGYKQARNRRRRLERLYVQTKYSCGSGAWYDEDKDRYVKFTASSTPGYAKLLRHYSNKKVRRAKDIGAHADYRKCYDYRWVLY